MNELEGFDARTTEPATGFDVIPDGEYTALIEESEKKPTKAGTGTYLQFTFQIIEGQFKSRKLWARLNFTNPNAQAQQIGRAELSSLCRAVGVMTPQKTAELHNIPLKIKVSSEKRADNGKMANVIDKFISLNGATSQAIAGAVTAGSSKPAEAQAASAAAPPWATKKS
jgi:hypothetical protein